MSIISFSKGSPTLCRLLPLAFLGDLNPIINGEPKTCYITLSLIKPVPLETGIRDLFKWKGTG